MHTQLSAMQHTTQTCCWAGRTGRDPSSQSGARHNADMPSRAQHRSLHTNIATLCCNGHLGLAQMHADATSLCTQIQCSTAMTPTMHLLYSNLSNARIYTTIIAFLLLAHGQSSAQPLAALNHHNHHYWINHERADASAAASACECLQTTTSATACASLLCACPSWWPA
jgi:hypothetical protein